MVREIKTTLAVDGEKAFNAALREAEREMRVMNADLKAMAAEFRATDDATKYFTERNETLGRKIKQQEEIVESLTRAVKESAEKYGEAGETTDGYRIKLSNATAKLFEMRREAEAAAKELEELGRDSQKVGTQLERGIGDAAEDVEDKLDGMFAKVASDIEALKSNVAFQTTMDVGGFVADAIGNVTSFVNENTELNRQLAIAKHNVESYDMNWDDVLDLVVRASSITGNQEGAIEAASHIAAIGVSNEELMRSAMDAILGAYIKTGGALSFESLAEDLRASVISRTPTGTYAEVLEEVLQGVVIEDVKNTLEGIEDTEKAFEVALAYLTQGGFQTETKSLEEKNAELLLYQQRIMELSLAWAELANELAPIITGVTDVIILAIDKLREVVKKGKEQLEYSTEKEIDEKITAGEPLTFNEARSKVWGDVLEWIENVFSGEAAEKNREEYLDSLELGIPSASAAKLPEGYETEELKAEWADLGEQLSESYYMPINTAVEEAETAGKDVASNLATGIDEGAPGAIQSAREMVEGINAELNKIIVPNIAVGSGIYNGYGGGAGASFGNISLNIDGQRAGSLLYDGISEAGGRAIQSTMLVK